MSERAQSKLEAKRELLDQIDSNILELLAQRFLRVKEVAEIKLDSGEAIRNPNREHEMLRRLSLEAKELGLSDLYVTKLYQRILEESVKIQEYQVLAQLKGKQTLAIKKVGYQGIESSYSSMACNEFFDLRGEATSQVGYSSFAAIAEDVAKGNLDYGVLPIENNITGPLNEVYDLLIRNQVAIVGELEYHVKHCLVAKKQIDLQSVERVYSHPQALMQCSDLIGLMGKAQPIDANDTADSAKQIAASDRDYDVAIASEEAALRYNLEILKKNIANKSNNNTRFVVIAKNQELGDDRVRTKVSLQVSTGGDSNLLLDVLAMVRSKGFSLGTLVSRPHPHKNQETVYLLDLRVTNHSTWLKTLDELRSMLPYVRVLGAYPDHEEKHLNLNTLSKAEEPALQPAEKSQKIDYKNTLPCPKELGLDKKPYKLSSRISKQEPTVLQIGNCKLGGQHKAIIAGPCSVESRQQIMDVAAQVARLGGGILRGGCFKPRTSPYAFQGLGYEGLQLLREAGDRYNLPIVTEVMHPEDIKPVAELADMIQVGARNMQNFSLLKEAGKVDCPIMLKRGLMASIDEWLSAAEYLLAHGNGQVLLCERGIRTFETATRNTLDLSAVPVLKERTHLPVIIDPSHASGTWRYIPDLSIASMAVGAHGIMVEVHPEPEKALSDGPQALVYPIFEDLMRNVQQYL
ncbi:MAG: bifunctional 3-deoxy-7-phosphoheptulonate synthase/chorismate mutase [Oligoflexales bacterium]|nr:bifunctional 3-deoxy-7-phosphoheptulonate synthase/chorismate mutase [Oligoflexales bacterium]